MLSTVPDAIAYLVSTLQGSSALAGVIVLDGKPPGVVSALEAVAVGWNGDPDDATAVLATRAHQGLSMRRDREAYEIQCMASVQRGSTADLPAARVRAYGLLAVVEDIVAADKTLGGAVMQAVVADAALAQLQDAKGAVAKVLFTVACDAFTKIS